MTRTNGQWRLAKRPVGMVQESDFERVDEPLREIEDGEVLVRNLFLAFEPAMRGWLDDVPSYIPPVAIGVAVPDSTSWLGATPVGIVSELSRSETGSTSVAP